jgi:tetratricopeptide (TPR) repeat protein
MKAAVGFLSIALAAALVGMLAGEITRYQGHRLLHSGETLVLAASESASPRQRNALLAAAERALTLAREKLADDPRPLFLLGSVSSMRGDHASAIEFLQQSISIEERPETDLNLALNWMAAGNAEAAAADALRAVWISPALTEKLPAGSRGPVLSAVRDTAHRLRLGDIAAAPELAPLDAAARENHGKRSRE